MSEVSPRVTWDGLPIADDSPTGSSVVVRRTTPAGEREVLLLHRNAHGADFEGDWAWTSPAGCRQPGEAVYPAALRELAEEAGLVGLRPWALDLSGSWAVFAVDVPYDVTVDLVDPEHDRFAWVAPPLAWRRVLPKIVTDGQARVDRVPAVDVAFRPMTDSDFGAVARWHRAPHVSDWWDDESRDEDSARARYAGRLSGAEQVRMWVLEVDGVAAGMLQDYQVADDPDYAEQTGDPDAIGFDYLIGEPALVGRGLGTRVIWEFCRDILHRDFPDAVHLLAGPSHRNACSLRVLAKCGFTPGRRIDVRAMPCRPADTEIVCTLEVSHWLGEDIAWRHE